MEVEPLLINKHKVKQILELWIIKQTLVNHVNAPLQPSLLVSISEVTFDATRVAPKHTHFQIPLYSRFANTKSIRHIFYCHSLLERNVPQFFQIKRDCFTATSSFFRLGTLTGMFWTSWFLPCYHMRWTVRIFTPNWSPTIVVSCLSSLPFLLLINSAWYTCCLTWSE